MITRLAISNYRSIGEPGVNLDLKPLTILIGANGTGKSSLLEAACLLTQGENNTLLGSLQSGELDKYQKLDSITQKRQSKREIKKDIYLDFNKDELNVIDIFGDAVNKSSLEVVVRRPKSIGYRYIHSPQSDEVKQSVLVNGKEIIKSGFTRIKKSTYRNQIEYPPQLYEQRVRGDVQKILGEFIFALDKSNEVSKTIEELAEIIRILISRKLFGKAFLISAARGDVRLEGNATASPKWIGKSGENLVELLSLIFGDRKYDAIRKKICKWADRFEISGLNAGWRGGSVLGADYSDSTFHMPFDLALAGYGSRQVLSIITQLFYSKKGDTIMVEEPELSLHPNSQALLPELFSDAVKDGKQVIITTHSETLPLALRRPIKNKIIKFRDIAVYHVEKREKGTEVKQLQLSEDGYIKGWIPSFAEVESQLLKEWAETIPKE